eukprot:COSAG06_NODE_75376_length_131_cov_6801.156250_1_plen_22_part_01
MTYDVSLTAVIAVACKSMLVTV